MMNKQRTRVTKQQAVMTTVRSERLATRLATGMWCKPWIKRGIFLQKRQYQMNIIDIIPAKSKILRFEFTNCQVFKIAIGYMQLPVFHRSSNILWDILIV